MSTPMMHDAAHDTAARDVLMRVVNRVALITLNRPAALNALSHDMVRELAAWLERCRDDRSIVAVVLRGAGDKGFCAGGDVRALYRMAEAPGRDWLPFFVDEYRLDYAIHTFPKPVVALMDGITMGGGMGLAQGAALRVSTERSKIAMPETRIGFVPDVGATHFLARLPVELSLYVGLTGATLSGADALAAKLADLSVPSSWLDTFEARLERADWSGDVLRALRAVFAPPCNVVPHAALDSQMPWIVRHFDKRSGVERIVATLRQDLTRDELSREQRQWLQTTLGALASHSPTMLEVTREALLRGRQMTLAESFRMELGIVARAIEEGDFREGVRAHLVDKDRKPGWAPATLVEVQRERIVHFLASPWKREAHPLADLGTVAG
ncbi:enoyl-CoA hydratase [Burkholderia pseudomallei MSHR338]|uniref:enoyl-CoA hydratase/isomerase family protein n=1 Tax=Burkholderia pseudomallei TaxID=28450 RepID=UPI0001A42599|nr:enoyl-CoA hydratase/isomerase family protein [Burkholderia pseudomallei]AIP08328.1 enoyl-CoA hydratase/isomerase family protein [Burkholderia pseudomallei]EEP50358.1 enoyl-CoA hydratase/isomerase family protein [Burkholderia pseudomallei MSHR346]EQA84759.1 enoyl-CoA hydratase [Burkholderia pseudomallei MSHR338]KGD42459.1 enoyl-CoA hydratase/isomerase family protein [Burkholderia pseudomallei]KGS85346.1 enoyl-CoA hydratase/isomerase family protein [Burkholderia pseudomallei MSHR7500]